MKRNKYINTFDTIAEYENYIESAAAGFPNVALTKDNDKVNYMSMSPNEHVIFGELVDSTIAPVFSIMYNGNYGTNITSHVDVAATMFYIDQQDIVNAGVNINNITGLNNFNSASINSSSANNVKSIKKMKLNTSSVLTLENMFRLNTNLTYLSLQGCDTSSVTTINNMLYYCSSLKTLDLSGCDFSSVTSRTNWITNCSALTDVYITVEGTLNKLTYDLTAQGYNNIPSNNGNCTIHYTNNGVTTDYKWQNNAWTPQS